MYYLFTILAFSGLASARNKFNLPDQAQSPLTATHSVSQPPIGFGTWNLKESGQNTTDAVAIAIEAGYRQIDCAAAYGNEKHVGAGIKKGLANMRLTRDQIWVTSKLWNDHHGNYTLVETALNQTLTDLSLSYLDLYLMHWPVGESLDSKTHPYDFVQTWSSMEKLLTTGRVRNIGVSNFSPAQMTELIKKSDVKPAAHQMELHPYLPQTEWVNWHKTHGISLTAYSPLGNMNPTYGDKSRRAGVTASKVPLLLNNEVVRDIAEKRDCTAAQVVLAWGMKRGVSVIPKSKHEMFIKQNIGAVECMLEGEDVVRMDGLEGKPVRFNNPSKGWGVDLFEGLEDA